ncbi:MAG: ABC transporter ATP-binding protein [Gillisia sp.]
MNEASEKFMARYFTSFTYFYKRLGYRIFIAMFLNICVGVLDGFGLAMFLPLLQMVGDNSVDKGGLGNLNFLWDGMESLGWSPTLFSILMMMTVFFILKGLAQYIKGIYGVVLKQFFIKKMRINLSNALAKMSYKSFVMANAGRIQNTMTGEVMRMSKAYLGYFGAFQQTVMVVVYMVFAILIDAKFAILICIGGGLTNFIYNRIYKLTKISSRKLTKGLNFYQGLILQFVHNFKYLKATGYLKEYNKKLKKSIEKIEKHNKKIGKLGSLVTAIREPVLIIVVSVVILIQVNFLDGSIGTILLSLLFFYRALSALIQLQTYYNEFLAVSGSMDNMTAFEQELEKSIEPEGNLKIERFEHQIALNNIGFGYAEELIIKNINLEIKKNETVAIVGESGSGKTTLVNIITALMPVKEGQVLIDGVDSMYLNRESFQRRIGYITQDPVIFTDTVFNNISFWSEPTPENLKRFWWAIQQASIDDYIRELPKREHTILGNNGVNLSGGQKQRISIARELFKDVDILVLDEATSALDSETEEAIQKSIEELKGKYTIILVSHRLSTIKNADRIIVMNNGEIVNEGSFSELVLNSSKFKKMVELQEL